MSEQVAQQQQLSSQQQQILVQQQQIADLTREVVWLKSMQV